MLVVGTVAHRGWLSWLAVPVGLLSGVTVAIGLGRAAERRLSQRGPEVFQVLATAPAGRR